MSTSIQVTDHAIIRYLERIEGINIPAIRQQLESQFHGGRLASAVEKFSGAEYKVKSPEAVWVVRQNRVVTCYKD